MVGVRCASYGDRVARRAKAPHRRAHGSNKREAISYATFRALVDLFPARLEQVYKPMMRELGYDPENRSTDIETPAGIGYVACSAVLEFRHRDRANQLGEMNASDPHSGPYDDWSDYRPANPPTPVPIRFSVAKTIDPNHWQPLVYTDSYGSVVVQRFADVQWCFVAPFAIAKGDEYRRFSNPAHTVMAHQSSINKRRR